MNVSRALTKQLAEAGLFGASIYSRRIMEKVQRANDEDGALPAALFSHAL
jgi:hypothetical protein